MYLSLASAGTLHISSGDSQHDLTFDLADDAREDLSLSDTISGVQGQMYCSASATGFSDLSGSWNLIRGAQLAGLVSSLLGVADGRTIEV